MPASNLRPFLVCLTISLVSCTNIDKHMPVSSIKELLMKLNNCDLQMIHLGNYHDKLSINDLNLVTRIIIPTYEFLNNPNNTTLTAVDILDSRVSLCRLSFILMPSGNWSSLEKRMNYWIKFASNYSYYYTDESIPNRTSVPNINGIVNVVLPSRSTKQKIWFTEYLPTFSSIVIIIAEPGQNFEVCFPHITQVYFFQLSIFRMVYFSKIYVRGRNFVSIADKQRLQGEDWCMVEEPSNKIMYEIFAKNGTFYTGKNCHVPLHASCIQKYKHAVPIKSGYYFELIFTKSEKLQFLTCYTVPHISFYFYLTPFQPELWLALGISIATIIVITTIVLHFWKQRQRFAAWLFILAMLFEKTGFMPCILTKSTFFRLSLGTWCIMSVILANCYNGFVISELNASEKFFHPDKFEHLLCNNELNDAAKFMSLRKRMSSHEVKQLYGYPDMKKAYDSLRELDIELSVITELGDVPFQTYDMNFTPVDDACYSLLSEFIKPTKYLQMPQFLFGLYRVIILLFENIKTYKLLLFGNLNLFMSDTCFLQTSDLHSRY